MEFEELKIEIPTEEDEEDDIEQLQLPTKKYENKAGSFVVGFDVNSKESKEKRARRQKRFGVIEDEKSEKENDKEQEDDDKSYELAKDIPRIPQAEVRLDALYVYGIQDLNTKDVFDYFQDYGPGSIEWIDDYSCNVVWDDEHSAATTLDSLGEDIDSPGIDSGDSSTLVWKAGPPCKKAGCKLVMRLSTKKDKKHVGAAKRSMYYLIHGHPNSYRGGKGKKGLVSKSRKRKIMQEQERARHKSSGEPDVAFIDKLEPEDEKMDVDEPPLKVMVKNDRTTEDIFDNDIPERLRLRMHADSQHKSTVKDRLQERLQTDLDNNLEKSSGDLRERLKSRRKHGFDFIDRPSLSIEIREEET